MSSDIQLRYEKIAGLILSKTSRSTRMAKPRRDIQLEESVDASRCSINESE